MKAKLAAAGMLLGSALVMAWPQPGEPAPSVTLPDTAWVTHTLPGEYRGSVILLNFWQSS